MRRNTQFFSKPYIAQRFLYHSKTKERGRKNIVSLAPLNKSDWENVDIYFPPFDTQKAIAAYFDQKCANIDKLITKLGDKIALFAEYRTRLISDVITGKLDVRGVAVPEYEVVEDVTGELEEEINTENTESYE